MAGEKGCGKVEQQFIEALGDACLVVSPEGRIIAANSLAGAMYLRDRDELAGRLVTELCPESEGDAVLAEIASCNGRPRSFHAVQRRGGGETFVGSFSAKACHSADHHVLLLVRETQDATDTREQDLTLRTMMLNHVTDGIVCHTVEGELLFANRTALNSWGVADLCEARALGPFGWVSDEMRDRTANLIKEMRRKGESRFESHGTGPDGRSAHYEIHSVVIESADGEYVLSSVRDISERLETQEMMRYLAYHDQLTGLANRVLLDTELAHAVGISDRYGDIVGVIFLDLNDFKPINDTYGHAAGDDVLREVANRIAGLVRETDTVARPGGDEFVVLLPRLTDVSDLPGIARALVDEIGQPIQAGDTPVTVNASVGLAVHRPGEDAASLLTRADLAMYRSREDDIPGWELFEETL